MQSCYSLDPTGINASYKEQEYRQKADDYRLLQSAIDTIKEAKNGWVKVEADTYGIRSVLSSIWLKYTNTFFRRRRRDSTPYYLAVRNIR